ncbi:MAG: hypothetical protein GF334_12720 [Candidatus Altiarchaeales archaeon]|nr:hypothetical protein [Candidatus Altiarchaeales archaeon]
MNLADKIARRYMKEAAILPYSPSEMPMRDRPKVLEKEKKMALRDLNRASALAYVNGDWVSLKDLESAKTKLRAGVIADPGSWKVLSDADRNLINSVVQKYRGDWKLVGANRYVPDDLRFGQGRIYTKDRDYLFRLVQIKKQKQKDLARYKG